MSLNLHKWIDLIGSKQKGRAAQDADNLFYWLTYELQLTWIAMILTPFKSRAMKCKSESLGSALSSCSLRTTQGEMKSPQAMVVVLAWPSQRRLVGEVQVAANAAEEAAAAAKAEEDAKNAAIEEARRRWHEKQRLEAEAMKGRGGPGKGSVLAEEQQKRDARTKAAAEACLRSKRVPNEATSTGAGAEKASSHLGGTPKAKEDAAYESPSTTAAQVFDRRESGTQLDLYSIVANFPSHLESGSLTTVRKKIHRSAVTAMCVGRSVMFTTLQIELGVVII